MLFQFYIPEKSLFVVRPLGFSNLTLLGSLFRELFCFLLHDLHLSFWILFCVFCLRHGVLLLQDVIILFDGICWFLLLLFCFSKISAYSFTFSLVFAYFFPVSSANLLKQTEPHYLLSLLLRDLSIVVLILFCCWNHLLSAPPFLRLESVSASSAVCSSTATSSLKSFSDLSLFFCVVWFFFLRPWRPPFHSRLSSPTPTLIIE